MTNNEVIAALDRLAATCQRGRDKFREAAENIQNSEFRRLFNIFSQQRVQFITELRSEVHRLRGEGVSEIEDTGELPGNTVPFKRPAVTKSPMRDQAGIIAECRLEEEAALHDYQELLKADLPLDVQYVVKRQYMDIKDAYDRIRILQRAA
jgi:uncharacterized protein (TIGR02284 family)